MIDFAVWHEGLEEGTGRWVLAIDGERVLLANDEGEFYWLELSVCKMVRIVGPDQARPVVPVGQPQQTPIVLPNRALRRNGSLN